MDDRAVRDILVEKAAEIGSQARLARAIGHSPAYLSQMLSGERALSDKVLRFLKLQRFESYEPIGRPAPRR